MIHETTYHLTYHFKCKLQPWRKHTLADRQTYLIEWRILGMHVKPFLLTVSDVVQSMRLSQHVHTHSAKQTKTNLFQCSRIWCTKVTYSSHNDYQPKL